MLSFQDAQFIIKRWVTDQNQVGLVWRGWVVWKTEKLMPSRQEGLLTMLTISGGAELPGEEVLAGCGERGCCQHQVYIALIFLQHTCRFST